MTEDSAKIETALERQKERFPDEKTAEAWLFRYRWPDGFACPGCGKQEYYPVPGRGQTECAGCGAQTALTQGTPMYKTRIPLYKWFWAVAVFNEDSRISAADLGRILDLTKPTAWLVKGKIQETLHNREGRILLSKMAAGV